MVIVKSNLDLHTAPISHMLLFRPLVSLIGYHSQHITARIPKPHKKGTLNVLFVLYYLVASTMLGIVSH